MATTLPELKSLLSGDAVKNRFEEILGRKAPGFISSVISVAGNNKLLASADPRSILNSAVIAATLDLPVNPNLGYAAIVPYKGQAQFQIMYKGLIELCQRSGQFASIIDEVVYEGQLVKKNKFTGEYVFDEDAKTSDKVIGYMAYFKLINGFEKTSYMSIEEVKQHAAKYSQTYKKGYGVWQDEFDVMARKTVLKLLLNKYAPKSIEMQRAVTFDQAVIKGNAIEDDIDSMELDYADAPQESEAKSKLNEMAEDAAIIDNNTQGEQ